MDRPSNVSTDRGLPFQWWHVVALGTGAWVLFSATTGFEEPLGTRLYDAIGTLAILAWPAIPVAMYLDLRKVREVAAWEPATKSWLLAALVPIANVPAGVAYCIRRNYAVRGVLPSENWRYGVYVGLLGWIGLVAADVAVDHVSIGALESIVFGPYLVVVWLGFPVAVYLDAVRFSRYPDRTPHFRALVVVSAIPLLNVLGGAVYAGVRWWARRKLDPDVSLTVPGTETGGAGRPEPISPWYRRAAAVFVAYFLLVAVLGSWLPLESDLAWDILSLVVWPPFGLAFTVFLHFDLRAVREAGVPWGDTRYLYYFSAIVPAPAFWYLLSRLMKVQRARSKDLMDGDDSGGEGEGDGSPTTGEVGPTTPSKTSGPDATDAGDGTGFEWSGGSRG